MAGFIKQYKKTKDFTEEQQKAIVAEYRAGAKGQVVADNNDIQLHTLNGWVRKFEGKGGSKKDSGADREKPTSATPKDESIGDFFKRFRSELEGKVTTLNARVKDAEKALEVALKELEDANAALAKLPGNDGPQG